MSARSTATLARAVPEQARELCRTLGARGHDAWVVGGCVRDVLMGREASDWDIATTALASEVQRIFRRTIPTGIDHGTVTVMLGREGYEVTTLRSEGGYSDGRRPDEVTFGASIVEDLGRRDFTVNAIAYDALNDALVDPWHGLDDLDAKLIRAVRDPRERFAEDGLRVLRAARFVASLGFDLDPATEAAIAPNLPTYARVSPERVRDEWVKAFKAEAPSRAFVIMRRTGMLEVHAKLLAELDEAAFERAMRRLDAAARGDVCARVAALAMDQRDERALDAWLRDLRFSNKEREGVQLVLRTHEAPRRVKDLPATRRFLRAVSVAEAPWLLDTLEAVAESDEAREDVVALRARCEAVVTAGDAIDLKALAITGADVMRLSGRGPGRYVGLVLERLLDEVIEDPQRNTQAALAERAITLAAELSP